MGRKLIPMVVLAALPLCAQTHSGLLQVRAVRFWAVQDITRIAIETTGEFQFHADRAHNPERLFFDIFRARPAIGGKRAWSGEVDDKLVSRIRVAETLPGVTRIVLDLRGPADFTTVQMPNPDRLVVELRPGRAEPAPVEPAASEPAGVKAAIIPEAPVPAPVETPTLPAAPVSVARNPQIRKASPVAAEPVAPPAAPVAPPPPVVRDESRAGARAPRLPEPEAAQSARRTADGSRTLTRALGLKINRVVIDAGHGGHDQGTMGPHGLLEKELVLDVALRLGKLIEQRMGAEVIYTRTDDTFVPLEGRTAVANEKKADLFLSIHANSSAYPRIAGIETYYLNFTDSKDALDVAARENASSQKSVYELQDLVQEIAKHEKLEESRDFAGRIQQALFTFEARFNPNARNRGVKKAPFLVLKGAHMPSVLAEIGFLSNPREESLLKKPDHRQKLAEALFRGVSRYAEGLSHFQVARAGE